MCGTLAGRCSINPPEVGGTEMNLPVFTNQHPSLSWRIAEAGIRPEHLLSAEKSDPILLSGNDLDVTLDGSRILVHFCKSTWHAEGYERWSGELCEFYVEFLCPVPQPGQRYSVNAETYFSPAHKMPVLAITHFTDQHETPEDTQFHLNQVYPAARFIEMAEEPSHLLVDLLNASPVLA